MRKFITVELGEFLEELRLKPIQHEDPVPSNFTGVCLFCLLNSGRYNRVSDIAFYQGRFIKPNKEHLNDPRVLVGRLYGVCRSHGHQHKIGHGYDTDLLAETLLDDPSADCPSKSQFPSAA